MHTPTLLLMACLLMGLMCAVLFAVSHFNRGVPGLRTWAFSYLFGFLSSLLLLARQHTPEVLSVVVTQGLIFLTAYCALAGSRAHVESRPVPAGYLLLGVALVMGAGYHFSAVDPSLAARVLVGSVLSGLLYLASAHALADGGMAQHPARYLTATAQLVHGLFLLARPWMLGLDNSGSAPALQVASLSQLLVLETILALILTAFGILMLVSEHITSELRRLAERDFLTGCFNRRAFMGLLDKAASLSQRQNSPLPLLLLDLDHFKLVNDRHGHKVGDQLLQHFVAVVSPCLRKEDVLGRMGGEEFAIFLPNAGAADAARVSERLRATVAAQPLITERGPVALTVSIGLAMCQPGEAHEHVLHRADQAMYRAKAAGRNRVETLAVAGA